MNTVVKQLYDAEPDSPLYVAINRVLVRNDPNLMRMMRQASSKMCLTTALTPGFKGFDLMIQLGACPMGMRWAASTAYGAKTESLLSSCFPIVVIEHTTKPFTTLNGLID